MTAVLLDTHTLMWWLFDSPRLSNTALQIIDEADAVYVSAASLYEIDSKRRFPRARSRDVALMRMPRDMPTALPVLGLRLLDISVEVAWRAANLAMDHGDPWDRILIAQAQALNVPLVSCDKALVAQAGDTPILW